MLPEELKQVRQWIVWKGDKKPYSAVTMQSTGWQKPENWTSYSEALRVCRECGFKGIGFVFRFPYVGIDLDDCIDDSGMMNDFAREITSSIDTYTEYSQSGRGLHLYCKVTEPIKPLKTEGLEVYGEGRYFIVTGRELDAGQDQVTEQTANIKALIAKYAPTRQPAGNQKGQTAIYESGSRNNGLTAEVGRLFRFYDKPVVTELAFALNKTICKPPLPDEEVLTIVNSISKRDTTKISSQPMEQREWSHIEGMRDLDAVPYRGLQKQPGRYIPTGIETVDYALNDLAPGRTTLIAGRSNSGKTTFVRQVVANAIELGNKVFIVNGEGEQEAFINGLYQCVIGRNKQLYDLIKINKRWHKEPKKHVLAALQRWHSGKLKIFNKHESKFKTTDELFELIDHEAKAGGHNLIVIDNLMSVLKATALEKNEAQADFMQRCCDLAKTHRTHVVIVLHPNKEYRPGTDLDMENISGSSDLYNKADGIIGVIREYKPETLAKGIDGHIKVLKNRYYPDLPSCDVHFDVETGLLCEIKSGDVIGYNFNWQKYLDDDHGDAWEPDISAKPWYEAEPDDELPF